MMEEDSEREEEAIQATQVEIRKEEEIVEARAELEQPVEETRNRNRGAEEAGAQSLPISHGGINCSAEIS